MILTTTLCPFCDGQMSKSMGGWDELHLRRCNTCHLTMMVDIDNVVDTIFIQLEGPYNIKIHFFDKTTILYKREHGSSSSLKFIMDLDYVINVTPQNLNEWVDRLLKLKAFS